MRVDRLHLKDYKNLRNFDVDFDVSSSRQVVVGRNGVGKSNLLEALAWIFRQLDLEEEATFAYEIEYHCNGHYVKIQSVERPPQGLTGSRRFTRSYWVVAAAEEPLESLIERPYKPVTQADFYRRNRAADGAVNPQRILPLYVFGYYSGVSDRFNEAFARHEEIYYREQISGEEAPLRPLFLSKPHHSQFALLSFFAANDHLAKEFLKNEFQIDGLVSVLFSLHEPYWKRSGRARDKSVDGEDPRFWRVSGKVAPFLGTLFEQSLAPMAGTVKKRVSLGQEKSFEMRYCFVPSEASLRGLAQGLQPKEFFARLESTIFSDLVSTDGTDVRIRVKLRGHTEPVTFKELSEGEQQLLTIIGLMRFTAQNESLFLLDEPDTHLNPAWCLDYLSNLRTYGVEPDASQILMTTHSPLTFAGLEANEVVILERGTDGLVYSQHPVSSPRGMGFQAILTSEFFQLRSALDKQTLEKIDRRRELALKPDKTEQDLADISALDDELGRLDFSKAARDPLYIEFIRAMTAVQKERPELGEPAPDTADWKLRQQVAKDIVQRMLDQGANK